MLETEESHFKIENSTKVIYQENVKMNRKFFACAIILFIGIAFGPAPTDALSVIKTDSKFCLFLKLEYNKIKLNKSYPH